MAQQISALAALPEVLCSNLSTHMEQLCNSSSEKSHALFWPPKALHVQDVQTYTETKQSDT